MAILFWDGALRGAAAGLFALLAFLFARDWRASLTARLGVLLTIAGICYLALPVIPRGIDSGLWRLPLNMMSLSGPGIFWLFVSSWFDDEYRLRPLHSLAVVASVACGLISNYYLAAYGTRPFPLWEVWRIASIGFVGAGILVSLRGRGDDLVEARRRVRLGIAMATGLIILSILIAELPLRGWPPPMGWRVLNAAGLFALAATLAIAALDWRDPELIAPAAKPAPPPESRSEPDHSALLARLDVTMNSERLYRENGLTITAVAARLGVPEYRLRLAINRGLGARNFNAYLNGFRLAETREALADPAQRGVPILTIALDAGFGSLAPFNRAFREAEGCTPSEFRAEALKT